MATILVVDDERPNREFLAQALADEGHHVLQAFHGRGALRLIAAGSGRPDLVISDVMMPLMGGVELCRALKADPETAGIPVILMSAAAPRATVEADADGFIAKPFDLAALESLVARVLGGQGAAP